MNPFRFDGHLHDLALEALLDEDPLDGAQGASVSAHLEACAICRDRLEAARAYGQAAQIPPQIAPAPANNQRHWRSPALALLLCAAVLLAVVPWLRTAEIDDGINVRGQGLQLRVYRDEGENSRRLEDGDRIAGGDRLGFSLSHRGSGHLMIIGIDANDAPYLCYPQRAEGRAAVVDGSDAFYDLDEAIRMDDTPGTERLVALLCSEPFLFEDAVDAVRSNSALTGCARSELTVVKP